MKANKRVSHLSYGDLYDAIQTGSVEAELGDLFNNRYLMVNY